MIKQQLILQSLMDVREKVPLKVYNAVIEQIAIGQKMKNQQDQDMLQLGQNQEEATLKEVSTHLDHLLKHYYS